MGTTQADIDGWSDRFMGAALEPHLWRGVLGDMAEATGSSYGQLVGFGPKAAAFNWISGFDDDMIAATSSPHIYTPQINFRVAADALRDAPVIVHESHYDQVRDTVRGQEYLDLCADLDIPNGCQTRLLAGDGGMIGFALLRSEGDGRTSGDQRAMFARFAGQAATAVRMQRAIEQQGFALLAGTFEAMDKACWLVDATGRVGGMTARAEQVMGEGRLQIKDGWLVSNRADETKRITQALRAVLGSPALAPDPVPLPDTNGGVAMMLEVFPLPTRPWDLPFAPRAIVTARIGALTDRQARALIGAFRLTRAEADIALRLASGASRPTIAAARGVSAETLKAQIRGLYEKIGCNRESQLVRIVNLIGS